MATIDPGQQKYPDSDSITYPVGSDAAAPGDAVAISASSGDLILTDGNNGFAGILAPHDTLQLQGVVRANVSANVGDSVSAGEKLEPGSSGALVNVDSDSDDNADQAGPGDLQAISDEDADGYALVKLP